MLGGDGTEHTYLIDESALQRLPEIRDRLAAGGATVLGGAYLETMVDWIEEKMPPVVFAIRSKRTGRYLHGVTAKGRAVTRAEPAVALTSKDRRRVSRKLTPQLVKRGYELVTI